MVTATGLGSGLDIDTLVTGIVDAERVPLMARVDRKKDDVESLISGYGMLSNALSDVRNALGNLNDPAKLTVTSSSSSMPTAVSVETSASAQPAYYNVDVTQLAQTQSLATGTFAATTDVIGSGTLTIGLGTPTYNTAPNGSTYGSFSESTSVNIVIAANSTVADVRDAINSSKAGVTASILKDGSNYRLMISSESSGINQGISISVSGDDQGTDSDGNGLSQLAFNSAASNLSQLREPKDAAFAINGLPMTTASNTVNDVVEGVTLRLLTTTTGASISVTRDTSAIEKNVNDFISAYNTFVGSQKSLTKYDPATGEAGLLQGEAMTRSLINQVRNLISSQISGLTGSFDKLSDIGISLQSDGSLKVEQTVLDASITRNMNDMEKLFVGETVNGTVLSGFATQLDTLLDDFIDVDGLIENKVSSLNDRLTALEEDRALFTQRMAALEARYFRQFNAMDSLLGQITSTGNMLQSQLDALPGYQNLRQSGSN